MAYVSVTSPCISCGRQCERDRVPDRHTPTSNAVRDALLLMHRNGLNRTDQYAGLVSAWEEMTGYDWGYYVGRNHPSLVS
jgi:hypothetical protein